MTDERLRVLLRDYRYAAYDVGARGKNHGRGEALEAAEAALVAYIEDADQRKQKHQKKAKSKAEPCPHCHTETVLYYCSAGCGYSPVPKASC